jgi:hypothetical protein
MSSDTEAVPIVDTVDEIGPEWMTAALRQSGTLGPDQTVTAVTTEPIGTGQVGLVVQASLEHDAADLPSSVVVKVPSPDAGSRQVGSAMGLYEAEVRFYEEIAPRLGPAIPRAYWGALVLEDLTEGWQVGDMVTGCTDQQARLAVGVLPSFQAPVWADPDLPGRPWLSMSRTDMLFGAVEPSLPLFLERFADRLDGAHVDLVRKLAPHAASYRERAWKPPYVVVHSDYRLDNMLFSRGPGAEQISVVDWQGARLGPPLLDAAVFLGACTSTEQRRALEDELLHSYHDGLRGEGVKDFSLDDCRDSYRIGSLWAFLLGVAISVSLVQTERGDAMWARLMAGCSDMVLDTGAASVLV